MAKHRRYGIEVVEAVINRGAVVAVFDRIEYPPAVPRSPAATPIFESDRSATGVFTSASRF